MTPETYIWLSVDPMADSRSWVSPYSYCQNNPMNKVDTTGALYVGPDNYSINKDGVVQREEITNDNFDMLYTKEDWDAGNTSNGLKVNDKSVLPSLTYCDIKTQTAHAVTGNISDAFNVFYFATSNTNVEWAITGFWNNNRTSKSYYLGTNHIKDLVTNGTGLSSIDVFDVFLFIHSHPGVDGTKGASYVDGIYDDFDRAVSRYHDYVNAGMKRTDTWFQKDNKNVQYPRHYVYHPATKTLYHYKPFEGQNSIFIRGNIGSGSQLYQGLGF